MRIPLADTTCNEDALRKTNSQRGIVTQEELIYDVSTEGCKAEETKTKRYNVGCPSGHQEYQ